MNDIMGKTSDELAEIDALANAALTLWPLCENARARRINVSENTTYLVESEHGKSVLRVHREGYHTGRAIECELAWSKAVRNDTAIRTPAWRVGRDSKAIQILGNDKLAARRMVMFDYVEGAAPQEDQDLSPAFRQLGAIAAEMHIHAITWRRPPAFQRLRWDLDAVFGATPTWGDWRAGPHVDAAVREVLELTEVKLINRLTEYGHSPERFGLIHADMRLANLIIDEDGPVLIDFDDCGFGWYLFDFAAAISFIEDSPQIPALKDAWLSGYQAVRLLTAADIEIFDTLIMLRRLSLLAWIGSHIEAPEPQALAGDFAANTAMLAEAFLSRNI